MVLTRKNKGVHMGLGGRCTLGEKSQDGSSETGCRKRKVNAEGGMECN